MTDGDGSTLTFTVPGGRPLNSSSTITVHSPGRDGGPAATTVTTESPNSTLSITFRPSPNKQPSRATVRRVSVDESENRYHSPPVSAPATATATASSAAAPSAFPALSSYHVLRSPAPAAAPFAEPRPSRNDELAQSLSGLSFSVADGPTARDAKYPALSSYSERRPAAGVATGRSTGGGDGASAPSSPTASGGSTFASLYATSMRRPATATTASLTSAGSKSSTTTPVRPSYRSAYGGYSSTLASASATLNATAALVKSINEESAAGTSAGGGASTTFVAATPAPASRSTAAPGYSFAAPLPSSLYASTSGGGGGGGDGGSYSYTSQLQKLLREKIAEAASLSAALAERDKTVRELTDRVSIVTTEKRIELESRTKTIDSLRNELNAIHSVCEQKLIAQSESLHQQFHAHVAQLHAERAAERERWTGVAAAPHALASAPNYSNAGSGAGGGGGSGNSTERENMAKLEQLRNAYEQQIKDLNSMLNAETERVNSTRDSFASNVERMQKDRATVEQHLQQKHLQLAESARTIESYKVQIAGFSSQLADTKSHYEQLIAAIRREADDRVAASSNAVATQTANVQSLQHTVDRIERDFQSQNTKLTAQLSEARREANAARESTHAIDAHHSAANQSLSMQVERLTAQNALLMSESELINNEFKRLTLENHRFQNELQRLETTIYGSSAAAKQFRAKRYPGTTATANTPNPHTPAAAATATALTTPYTLGSTKRRSSSSTASKYKR